jgi:uncharacterized cupredoxin-like copper-binding protein
MMPNAAPDHDDLAVITAARRSTMARTLTTRLGATLVAGALIVAACGGGTSPGPTTGGGGTVAPGGSPAPGGATTIDVTLQEWAVIPSADAAPAGDVTFRVTNAGPEDIHEFVVLKTDLGAGSLPVDGTGTVDETGGGIEVIDEVEDLAVDGSEELTVTLEAGSYVLLCNIYDETEQEAHYAMGMHIDFTVN